ncbi:diguanylate cyclase (GGDEF)-like protein [Elusimicrobium simillimum]|uniref:sensor domain-containing diguanylate cyclase n=1 Tax=Elusimicrobium simillimum TaxID=3143438 RepID=UPI003C6EC458
MFKNKHKPNAQLYYFHKELNQSFKDTFSLLNKALPLMQKILELDRIYFFNWSKEDDMLALSMLCKDGECFDMQENISTITQAQLMKELVMKGYAVSNELSYPAVYVLLKWKAPGIYEHGDTAQSMRMRYGVLRLERFSKSKKFTPKDIDLVLGLASELSHNMINTEIDQDNAERLRLATKLNELATVFANSMRFNDAIEIILKGVQKTFKFDRVRMYLFDYKGEHVRAMLSTDIAGNVVRKEGEIPAEEVRAVTEQEKDFNSRVLSLPLNVSGKRVGIMIFDNLLSRRVITALDFSHVKQFAAQIALAIDNAVLFERVQDLYNYDELTKLPVRRYFNEKLSEEIYRSKRFELTMSVIIIDIDHFKNINDTFGHHTGDIVLKKISEVILGSLRQTDFPCRYGGDEIMIMLPRTSGNEAKFIAKRIAQRVREVELSTEYTNGQEYGLSISQGIAVFPQDSRDAIDLFNKADRALYYAKNKERGTYALYNEIPLEDR